MIGRSSVAKRTAVAELIGAFAARGGDIRAVLAVKKSDFARLAGYGRAPWARANAHEST